MARFTAANARDMAAKAHEARRQRLASENVAPEPFPQTSQVGPHEAPSDYVNVRLSRVRAQLDLVDKRILDMLNPKHKTENGNLAEPLDGQVLNWLCAAQEKLAEQERIASGRPLPGSRRPGRERDNRRQTALDGWEARPVPAAPPLQPA
jgi:hypothetical protein